MRMRKRRVRGKDSAQREKKESHFRKKKKQKQNNAQVRCIMGRHGRVTGSSGKVPQPSDGRSHSVYRVIDLVFVGVQAFGCV